MIARKVLTLLILGGFAAESVHAQSKVESPESTHLPSETSAAQVHACLLVARDISDLTDRANASKRAGDTEAFNATVDPYNEATDKWNVGCTRPYVEADMIRAENATGLRLCEFTQTPCKSEIERHKVLMEEAKLKQGGLDGNASGVKSSYNMASDDFSETRAAHTEAQSPEGSLGLLTRKALEREPPGLPVQSLSEVELKRIADAWKLAIFSETWGPEAAILDFSVSLTNWKDLDAKVGTIRALVVHQDDTTVAATFSVRSFEGAWHASQCVTEFSDEINTTAACNTRIGRELRNQELAAKLRKAQGMEPRDQ